MLQNSFISHNQYNILGSWEIIDSSFPSHCTHKVFTLKKKSVAIEELVLMTLVNIQGQFNEMVA